MRWKMLWLFLLVLLVTTSSAAQEGVGVVNAGVLNVRAAPTTESPIIAQVRFEEPYPVIARLEDASWWQIRLSDDRTGWVFGRFLTVATPLDSVPVVDAPVFVPSPSRVAITQGVNVRSGPGTDFTIIDGLPENTEITLIGRDGRARWVKIQRDNGATGWIIAGVIPEAVDLNALPVPPDAIQAAIIQGLFWRVRDTARVQFGPLLSTPLLGFVNAGQSVQIIGRLETNAWVKVLFNGDEGWIQADAFTPENDVTLLPLVNFK
ncbi:MAG: hypothetical protein OHK0046_13060 [Anaerolineae bacterium]